jgi:hypothetical protein
MSSFVRTPSQVIWKKAHFVWKLRNNERICYIPFLWQYCFYRLLKDDIRYINSLNNIYVQVDRLLEFLMPSLINLIQNSAKVWYLRNRPLS